MIIVYMLKSNIQYVIKSGYFPIQKKSRMCTKNINGWSLVRLYLSFDWLCVAHFFQALFFMKFFFVLSFARAFTVSANENPVKSEFFQLGVE